MKFKIENNTVKKVLGFVPVVVAGAVAVINALSEQKQAQEFEALKEAVSELQKNQ